MRQCSYLLCLSLLGITLWLGQRSQGAVNPQNLYTQFLLQLSPARWRTEIDLPFPNAQSWLANMDT